MITLKIGTFFGAGRVPFICIILVIFLGISTKIGLFGLSQSYELSQEFQKNDQTQDTLKNESGIENFSDEVMDRIEKRFKARRERLVKHCEQKGTPAVNYFYQINPMHKSFLWNHIFHDPKMNLSGCIPPKTGSTSWNHFWWGTSKFDGDGWGRYNSYQVQGNFQMRTWGFTLRESHPILLFMQTRNPIDRLVSGWNNVLCDKNCRNEGILLLKLKYLPLYPMNFIICFQEMLQQSKNILKQTEDLLLKKLNISYKPINVENTRITPFPDFVKIQLDNDLDQFDEFNIHFRSYESYGIQKFRKL